MSPIGSRSSARYHSIPCTRLLAQFPTPTMPTGIFPIFLPRAGGERDPARSAAHILNRKRAGNGSRNVAPRSLLAETGRKVRFEGLLGMEDPGLGDELLLGLRVVRIRNAAIDGTHGGALLLIEEPDALGALLGHDEVDVLHKCGMRLTIVLPRLPAFIDGGVGTLGLAGPAVDALLGDHRRHRRRTLQCAVLADNPRRADQGETPVTAKRGAWRTASATRAARVRKAALVGCAGSASTIGHPRSPPSRIAGASGMRASSGTPARSASRSPPPVPNSASSVPHSGQT